MFEKPITAHVAEVDHESAGFVMTKNIKKRPGHPGMSR
jgi:hypothetical protein